MSYPLRHILNLIRQRDLINAELAHYGIDKDGNVNLELPQETRDLILQRSDIAPDLLEQLNANMNSRPPGWLDRNSDLLDQLR